MNSRTLEVPATAVSDATELVIVQESESKTGGVIWDAALVLEAFIRKTAKSAPHLFDGKYLPVLKNATVLDLGTGTGFMGLSFLPYRCKNIILTDLPTELGLAHKNIDLNQKVISARATSVEARAFDWTDQEHLASLLSSYPQIDLISASDIVFIPEIAPKLLNCLKCLLTANPAACLLLSLAYRTPSDKEFVSILEEWMAVEAVEHEMMDEIIQSDDIDVFLIRLKP